MPTPVPKPPGYRLLSYGLTTPGHFVYRIDSHSPDAEGRSIWDFYMKELPGEGWRLESDIPLQEAPVGGLVPQGVMNWSKGSMSLTLTEVLGPSTIGLDYSFCPPQCLGRASPSLPSPAPASATPSTSSTP